MKWSFPKSNRQTFRNGQLAGPLAMLIFLATVFTILLSWEYQRMRAGIRRQIAAEVPAQTGSGIEMMLLAYRLAEAKYVKDLNSAGCWDANPFLRALKEGTRCPGLANSVVFTSLDNPYSDPLFDYGTTGCTISPASSSCASGLEKIINAGITDPAKSVDGTTLSFSLLSIKPQKGLAEFNVSSRQEKMKTGSVKNFAIRPILPNAAHLENNGRVTQENPDPLARCTGSPWADYLFFDLPSLSCMKFANLGSGTGLAYFKGRYFGFRPSDGQVIDLMEASTTGSTSYLVDPVTGLTGSGNQFVPYDKSSLMNVDDLTLIEDQIYYVAYGGKFAHIGMLVGNTKVNVCSLGSMGWSQSYSGIAALNWSDPLRPSTLEVTPPPFRLAVFFLKTDSGDLVQAIVRGTATGGPYTCHVLKDINQQQVEYRRTDGFDRTSDSKPYFIY